MNHIALMFLFWAAVVLLVGCWGSDTMHKGQGVGSPRGAQHRPEHAPKDASKDSSPLGRWFGPPHWQEVATREDWKAKIINCKDEELGAWFDTVDIDLAIDESLRNGTLTWIGFYGIAKFVPGAQSVDRLYANVWFIPGTTDVNPPVWQRQAERFAERFNTRVIERELQWAPQGLSEPVEGKSGNGPA